MTKPHLIPYKAEHSMLFKDRDGWTDAEWKSAFEKEKYPAYTGMYGDEVLGCAGIMIPWPGMGMVWLTMSPTAALKFKIWLTKTCKRVIDDVIRSHNLYRLEALVLEDIPTNQRWIEHLGFTVEQNGRAANYLPDKRSMIRYERIM
jgi:hypothetical protein